MACAKRLKRSSRSDIRSTASLRSPADEGPRLFTLILGLVVVLKAAENFRRPLQADEAYTLWLAHIPLRDMFARLLTHDVHPPLVFLMLRPLEHAGLPDWFFRALMLGFALGSLVVLYWIVKLWSDDLAARIAVVSAGLLPSLIYYDSWVRMYAVFHLEALLSFLILSALLVRESLGPSARRWLWVAWVLVSVAAWYTLYLGIVVTVAQVLFAAIVRRDGLARMLAGAVAIVALWAPQAPTFLHQQQFGGVAFAGFRGYEGIALGLLAGNVIFAQLEITRAAVALSAAGWMWLCASFASVVRLAGQTLLPWLGAPSALLIIYSLVTHKLLYADRYHLLLSYALSAWTGVALARLASKMPAAATAGATAGGIALLALAALRVMNSDYTTAPWPDIASFLRSREQPGDLLVLDQGNSLWALQRYGAVDSHPTLNVYWPQGLDRAVRQLDPYPRIWYVGFQWEAVDPSQVALRHLSQHWRLVGVWRYDRNMVTEHVFIGLFQK